MFTLSLLSDQPRSLFVLQARSRGRGGRHTPPLREACRPSPSDWSVSMFSSCAQVCHYRMCCCARAFAHRTGGSRGILGIEIPTISGPH
jgi:hypothetical protein